MNWYYSGFPYSDELYHHGIKNQKWGLRRYQNEDGSLTALGRIHYGVGKARDAVVKAYKRKHPSLMSDDELTAEINRQKRLNELKKAKEEGNKGSAGEKAKEIMWSGAKTAVTTLATQSMIKIGQGIGDRILETHQQKTLREMKEKADMQEAAKRIQDALQATYESTSKAIDAKRKFEAEETKRKTEDKAAKDAKREEAKELKRKADQASEYEKQRKEQYNREAQNAHADAVYRLEQMRRKREQAAQQAAQRREEANRKAQQMHERKEKAKEIVDTIFRNERIRNADYKDSMTQMRKRAEYNAAKRRALQLAEEGSRITVAELFFDGNIDG